MKIVLQIVCLMVFLCIWPSKGKAFSPLLSRHCPSLSEFSQISDFPSKTEIPRDTSFYYLANTGVMVGSYSTKNGFRFFQDIKGQSFKTLDHITIAIDSVEILDTKLPHLKYLSVRGTSRETASAKKEGKIFYHLAFQLYDEPFYNGGEKYTIISICQSPKPPSACAYCEFTRDESGVITGCRCEEEPSKNDNTRCLHAKKAIATDSNIVPHIADLFKF